MKKLKIYAHCFFVASIFCTVAFATAIILQPLNWMAFAVAALAAGLIAVSLFAAASNKMKAARLIVDNQILHIQPAVFDERTEKKGASFYPFETMEVFVSCFGILLNAKIIKFNQDGIQLKAVEIGRDYLSIDYGTDAGSRNIRLLYARPDSAVLSEVIEKFHCETGITPTITN